MALANANAKMRLVAALALASGVAACSMLAGLTEDYRYTGGPGSSNEGGSETGSQDGDAPGDGQASDTSMPNDGGGDGSTVPLCTAAKMQPGVALCTDFETGSDQATGWTLLNDIGDAGSTKLSTTDGVGPSSALEFSMTYSGGMSRHLWLAKKLPSGNGPSFYRHYEVDFDFRIPSGDSTLFYVALGTLSFTSTPDPEQDHGVATQNGNGFGKVGTIGPAFPDDNQPPHWHHVRLVLDRADASTTYTRTITIDTAGVPNSGMKVDDSSGHNIGNTGDTEFRLGTFNTAGTGTIRAVFDNVVVRRY